MNKEWPVTEIEAAGIPNWGGGAYSHFFVYSNQGNFLLKGYYKEVSDHLEKLRREKGLQFVVNKVMFSSNWKGTKSRSIWGCSDKRVVISEPDPTHVSYRKVVWKPNDRKWTITIYKTKRWEGDIIAQKRIKRMPNRFIPELFKIEQNGQIN